VGKHLLGEVTEELVVHLHMWCNPLTRDGSRTINSSYKNMSNKSGQF